MPHKDPEKRKEYEILYRLKNKEKIKEQNRLHYQENKEKKRLHYQENKEELKLNREEHKEEIKERNRLYRLKFNKEELTEKKRLYYKTPEGMKSYTKANWRQSKVFDHYNDNYETLYKIYQ